MTVGTIRSTCDYFLGFLLYFTKAYAEETANASHEKFKAANTSNDREPNCAKSVRQKALATHCKERDANENSTKNLADINY